MKKKAISVSIAFSLDFLIISDECKTKTRFYSLTYIWSELQALKVGKLTQSKKSCHGQVLINKCSSSDYLVQTVFVFSFLGSYIFISHQKSRLKATEKEIAFLSFPLEFQMLHVGLFHLFFTYLP